MKTEYDEMVGALGVDPNKFKPKLDETKRRQIYALTTLGITKRVVAKHFGVHHRTVCHIVNKASPNYKSTRAAYQEMGREAFHAAYLTPDLVKAVMAINIEPSEASSKRNDSQEGEHRAKSGTVFDVQYREPPVEDNAGWYWHDTQLDGWIGPFSSSTEAMRNAEIEL